VEHPNPIPWSAGSPILLREIWQGKVWTARPVTVVQDTDDTIVLYMRPGTVYKHPRTLAGAPVPYLLPDAWRLVDVEWYGGGALYLSLPGAWYMLILFFADDRVTPPSWYVNLQDPLRRTRLGFDYLDQELDIVLAPDLPTWQWKDEEKFADLRRRGLISAAKARRLREVGEQVLGQRQDPGSLFHRGWDRWSPPADWPIPTLPNGWDRVV